MGNLMFEKELSVIGNNDKLCTQNNVCIKLVFHHNIFTPKFHPKVITSKNIFFFENALCKRK